MYVELTALKGLLREKKTSYEKIAEFVGVATNTFSDKINGYSLFDAIEIDKVAEYFAIDVSEMGRYFSPRRQC